MLDDNGNCTSAPLFRIFSKISKSVKQVDVFVLHRSKSINNDLRSAAMLLLLVLLPPQMSKCIHLHDVGYVVLAMSGNSCRYFSAQPLGDQLSKVYRGEPLALLTLLLFYSSALVSHSSLLAAIIRKRCFRRSTRV